MGAACLQLLSRHRLPIDQALAEVAATVSHGVRTACIPALGNCVGRQDPRRSPAGGHDILMVIRRQWCNGTLRSWQNDLGATAQAARSGLVVRAAAKAGNWLPGETLLQKAGCLDVM